MNLTKSDLAPISKKMEELGLKKETILKECSFAMQAINKSPQLQKATMESKQAAILNIAQTGLTLNPVMKLAYLVPRWSRDKGSEVYLEPSYQGLVKLLTDSGSVKAINAQLVYKEDEFSSNLADFDNPITHKPNSFGDRGAVIGVYALALLHNGAKQAEIIGLDELHKIRERSEAYKAFKAGKLKSCVWTTDEGEMMRKSIVRRFVKYLPKSNEDDKIAAAISLDESDYKASDAAKEYASNLLLNANVVERIEISGWEHRIETANSKDISEIIEELKEIQIDNGTRSKTALAKELKERIG
jgi:recombination protein RecT